MSIVQKLTEGMVQRSMQKEGAALLKKWSQTGLLEGLSSEDQKGTMARLLENQARELLRESNTMAGGDVEGFAAVAFPIVRRVFAGLIANDLVSVQPMSLPSGLIFFLDFKFGTGQNGQARLGQNSDDSIYGQGIVGSEVTTGVRMTSANMDKQPFSFGSALSSPTGSFSTTTFAAASVIVTAGSSLLLNGSATIDTAAGASADQLALLKLLEWDTDLIAEYGASGGGSAGVLAIEVAKSAIESTGYAINMNMLSQIHAPISSINAATNVNADGSLNIVQVRRLTKYDASTGNFTFFYIDPAAGTATGAIVLLTAATTDAAGVQKVAKASFPTMDQFGAGSTPLGSIAGTANWPLENVGEIPEIDIKVDSIAITAVTKKLKAKWTPELGQDLNAYHNLDAEVELTSVLSEQIALEIDREILSDLVNGATAGTYYWSRNAGMFVNRLTGAEVGANVAAPDFTGTVSEWYETLIETINDVSAQIHRKTLRGGANFVVCSPEVANILEFTAGFRANVTADADKGDIGAVKVGSLNKKFEVIVDPYFPRNAILVGRKGKSFLESGYVYAPYVPLQTTPTIFGTEDFVPRKGVMTRYGKKMVRPDMYGLVIVRDLQGTWGGA